MAKYPTAFSSAGATSAEIVSLTPFPACWRLELQSFEFIPLCSACPLPPVAGHGRESGGRRFNISASQPHPPTGQWNYWSLGRWIVVPFPGARAHGSTSARALAPRSRFGSRLFFLPAPWMDASEHHGSMASFSAGGMEEQLESTHHGSMASFGAGCMGEHLQAAGHGSKASFAAGGMGGQFKAAYHGSSHPGCPLIHCAALPNYFVSK